MRKPCKPCNTLVALWGAPRSMQNTPFHSQDASACGWGMKGHEIHALPTDDATAERVRVTPQGPLGPPAPRGPRVEPRGARAGHNRALRVAQAVPGGEAHRTKMSYVHAERAPEALMDPADPWGTLGVHVVAAKGARGARVGGGVTVRSLVVVNY